MKYKVRRACGHEETVVLYGKEKDRQAKIEWLERTVCLRCYVPADCDEVEMKYSEYKRNYPDCRTKKDSYDEEKKTVIVFVPIKTEDEAEAEVSIAEALYTILDEKERAETEEEKEAWRRVEKGFRTFFDLAAKGKLDRASVNLLKMIFEEK